MNNVIAILNKVGAIMLNGHFVYTSGKHGSIYINKDALYPRTGESSSIGMLFAKKFKNKNIDVVVAPALGGIVLSQWTAFHLSALTGREILGIYTEKTDKKDQIFTRGYDKLILKKNALVIEDITTTGGSLAKTIKSVKIAGGKVISVCTMINRDPDNINSAKFGLPFFALGVLKAEAFAPKSCPLCRKKIPINYSVGHALDLC